MTPNLFFDRSRTFAQFSRYQRQINFLHCAIRKLRCQSTVGGVGTSN